MVEELKREHDTVYREIMKLKTFQVLVHTGFSSYGIVSSMHRKKLGF